MSIYVFERADGFYPLDLESDEEAIANAKCNLGTVKVTNAVTGETVFEEQAAQ